MTGEKNMFTSFQPNQIICERIVFGDNCKGDILGFGKIAISNDNSILKCIDCGFTGIQFIVYLKTL